LVLRYDTAKKPGVGGILREVDRQWQGKRIRRKTAPRIASALAGVVGAARMQAGPLRPAQACHQRTVSRNLTTTSAAQDTEEVVSFCRPLLAGASRSVAGVSEGWFDRGAQ
jgi:hypothetical protein